MKKSLTEQDKKVYNYKCQTTTCTTSHLMNMCSGLVWTSHAMFMFIGVILYKLQTR